MLQFRLMLINKANLRVCLLIIIDPFQLRFIKTSSSASSSVSYIKIKLSKQRKKKSTDKCDDCA